VFGARVRVLDNNDENNNHNNIHNIWTKLSNYIYPRNLAAFGARVRVLEYALGAADEELQMIVHGAASKVVETATDGTLYVCVSCVCVWVCIHVDKNAQDSAWGS